MKIIYSVILIIVCATNQLQAQDTSLLRTIRNNSQTKATIYSNIYGISLITLPGLPDIQKFQYEFELKTKLQQHCSTITSNIKIDAVALFSLLERYRNNPNISNFTHLQIQLGEINNATNIGDYYSNNQNKLHLLFFAYNSIDHEYIDNIAYDLTYEITNSDPMHLHEPVIVNNSVVSNFVSYYQTNMLKIIEETNPKFDDMKITGVQKINIDQESTYQLLNNDPSIALFEINLAIVRKFHSIFYSKSDYAHFAGMDGVLNLLFQKRNDLNQLTNDYYDLNDACPPGNCH